VVADVGSDFLGSSDVFAVAEKHCMSVIFELQMRGPKKKSLP